DIEADQEPEEVERDEREDARAPPRQHPQRRRRKEEGAARADVALDEALVPGPLRRRIDTWFQRPDRHEGEVYGLPVRKRRVFRWSDLVQPGRVAAQAEHAQAEFESAGAAPV